MRDAFSVPFILSWRKLLQITSALLITKMQITTKCCYKLRQLFFITNYDEVLSNCDTYSKLRQNYYKLPQVLQITTERPQYKDSSYERVAVTLFRCVS